MTGSSRQVEVLAIDTDGTGAVNLTNDGGLDGRPDWQPVAATAPPAVTIETGDARCAAHGRTGAVDLRLSDPDTAPSS